MHQTTYWLEAVTDPNITVHGWRYEITVFMDGEDVHSKLYRNATTARRDLVKRSELARTGGNAGIVVVIDRSI